MEQYEKRRAQKEALVQRYFDEFVLPELLCEMAMHELDWTELHVEDSSVCKYFKNLRVPDGFALLVGETGRLYLQRRKNKKKIFKKIIARRPRQEAILK